MQSPWHKVRSGFPAISGIAATQENDRYKQAIQARLSINKLNRYCVFVERIANDIFSCRT
jgi:hypothetical protein